MAPNIKNAEVERLAADISEMTGESKTETIRKALEERHQRLGLPDSATRLQIFRDQMEREVWSKLPSGVRGHRIPKEEYDALFA